MAVASVVFMLLAIFYYEYVPEGAYDEGTFEKKVSEFFFWNNREILAQKKFKLEKDLSEKSSISSNSDNEDDEKKMKEMTKAEEAGINENNDGEENEGFEEESF